MYRSLLACAVAACLLVPLGARSATESTVTIDKFAFSPAVLTVSRGTQVTWTNHDKVEHSIVLSSADVRSQTLGAGGGFSYTFEQAGTFAYICGVHSYMKGQVVVK